MRRRKSADPYHKNSNLLAADTNMDATSAGLFSFGSSGMSPRRQLPPTTPLYSKTVITFGPDCMRTPDEECGCLRHWLCLLWKRKGSYRFSTWDYLTAFQSYNRHVFHSLSLIRMCASVCLLLFCYGNICAPIPL